MHAVYANAQRLLFTRVTLNELVGRDIDLLKSTDRVFVKVSGGVDETIETAARSVRHQFLETGDPIILDLDQCKALRRVERIWYLAEGESGK